MKKIFFTLLSCAAILMVQAQKPVLTKDINTVYISGTPTNYYAHNGWLYFAGAKAGVGTELWRTDGTTKGTEFVKDIWEGASYGSPANFGSLGKTLFFSANDGTNGVELWKSDSAGTVLVKDIYPGTAYYSSPANLTPFNGKLYFSAATADGRELWVTDGTDTGTKLVKDIYAGSGSSNPKEFKVVNNTLYFVATDISKGTEVWKTDGTETGTVMVKDIYNGGGGSSAAFLTAYKNKLYFSATNGTTALLWRSDGTDTGTKALTNAKAYSNAQNLCLSNGKIFFTANGSTTGNELYKSDGTDTGTLLVKDLESGTSSSSPQTLVDVNGLLFFTATGYNGRELHISDGTATGTKLIKDMYPIQTDAQVNNMTAVGNTLFFTAHASPDYLDIELYKSNGTSSGTVKVKDIIKGTTASNPHYLTAFNGKLIFSVNDQVHGDEVWISDGTANGTNLLADIYPATMSSSITSIAAYPGGVMFNANTPVLKDELWKSNGDTASTQLVKDLGTTNNNSAAPNQLTSFKNEVYFATTGADCYGDFFHSNGTATGTSKIGIKSFYGTLGDFTEVKGSLYFTWYSSLYPELWKYTSGNSASKVVTINNNGLGDEVDNLIGMNGYLYFTARETSNTGNELYRSDGTSSGTKVVRDIYPDYKNSNPSNLTVMDTTLFFTADDGSKGRELWKTNGTYSSTVMVKEIVAGASSPGINNMVAAKGKVYFVANNTSNGAELWSSNGTSSGTKMIKDIFPGTKSGNPTKLTMVGNTLYFVLTDSATGSELWKSDGTDSGTVLVKDINPGTAGSNIKGMIAVRDELYFSAFEASTGQELWKTNGTEAGTVMLPEVYEGVNNSDPALFTLKGDTLFFTANHPDYGNELWWVFTQCMSPSFTSSVGCAGTPINFEDKSDLFGKTLSTRFWDFGKGDSATTSNVDYTFNAAGNYKVTLKIKNSDGCEVSATKNILVYDSPKASFTINNDSQCLGANAFVFTNKSTPSNAPKKYQWKYGNGTSDTLTTGAKTYTTAQNFNVKLITTIGKSCSDSSTQVVTVLPKPSNPVIVGKSVSYSAFIDTMTVTNTVGSLYTWVITNGVKQSGGNTNQITVKWNAGPITATVKVTETDKYGCASSQVSKSVNVQKSGAIQSLPDKGFLKLFPNPSKNLVTIELDRVKAGAYKISVINTLGQIKYENEWYQSDDKFTGNIDISSLAKGVYILKISNALGEISSVLIKD